MNQRNVSANVCLSSFREPFRYHLADDGTVDPSCLRSELFSSTVTDNSFLSYGSYFSDSKYSPALAFWPSDTTIPDSEQEPREDRPTMADLPDIIIHREQTPEQLLSSFDPVDHHSGCLFDDTTDDGPCDLDLTTSTCNISGLTDYADLGTGPLASLITTQANLDKGTDSRGPSDTTASQASIDGFSLGFNETEAEFRWSDMTELVDSSLFYEATPEGFPVQIADAHQLFPKSFEAITGDDASDSYMTGDTSSDDMDSVVSASDSSSAFLANESQHSPTLTSSEPRTPELCSPHRGTRKSIEFIDLTDDSMPFSQPWGLASVTFLSSGGSISKNIDLIDLTQEDDD